MREHPSPRAEAKSDTQPTARLRCGRCSIAAANVGRRLASASPPTSAVRQDTLDLMSASNALGGYLDTKNVLRRSGSGDGGEGANESGEASAKASQALELLAQAQFPTTMPTLLAESGWDVGDFAQAIDVLRKASLIDVTKDGDTETVQLTEQGKALRPS